MLNIARAAHGSTESTLRERLDSIGAIKSYDATNVRSRQCFPAGSGSESEICATSGQAPRRKTEV